MKFRSVKFRVATAFVFALALVACRGSDPDQAPPIGIAPAQAAPLPATAIAPASPRASGSRDVLQRSRLYREAAADARHQLDMAWNRCGNLDGDHFARCRDDAVVMFDQTMDAARREYGDDVKDHGALVPGTLQMPETLAVTQVTGVRG